MIQMRIHSAENLPRTSGDPAELNRSTRPNRHAIFGMGFVPYFPTYWRMRKNDSPKYLDPAW